MENKAKKPLELYVHIPFCVKKCDYCDFLSGPAGKERQAEYFRALEKEVAAVSDFPDREITTVLSEEERPPYRNLRLLQV